MTTAPPKITFGHKSVSANYIANPQVTTSIYVPNQTTVTQYYEKPANVLTTYQYTNQTLSNPTQIVAPSNGEYLVTNQGSNPNAYNSTQWNQYTTTNQVVSGNQPQTTAPPTVQYRSTNIDPRVSTNVYTTNQWNTGERQSVVNKNTVVVAPTKTLVKEQTIAQQIQRPKYSQRQVNTQPSKKAAPDQDPKGAVCNPCWWIIGIIIGLLLLGLALLYGLGVFGGSNNAPVNTTAESSNLSISPVAGSTSVAPPTEAGSSTTPSTAPSSISTAPASTDKTAASISPSSQPSTNTIVPVSGQTGVSPIPYYQSSASTDPSIVPQSIDPIQVKPVVVSPIPGLTDQVVETSSS